MLRIPRGTRHGTCCHASYILFAAQSRLLLFILLNIIHASKRVTQALNPDYNLSNIVVLVRYNILAHIRLLVFAKNFEVIIA